MYVYIYTYMRVYIYVCMYVRMYLCLYLYLYLSLYTYIYIHTYVCMCIYIYIYIDRASAYPNRADIEFSDLRVPDFGFRAYGPRASRACRGRVPSAESGLKVYA